ncbi:MAG: ATPase, T2SS/T4P/T4SS family [Actinomycetota bacterium]
MRTNLGEVLMQAGVISDEQWADARTAWGAAPDPKPPIQHFLIESGAATDKDIARTLAERLGLEYIELIGKQIDPMLIREVPERLATRHQIVPVSRTEDELVIAMSDPTNVVAIDDIRIASRASHVTVGIAPLSAIHETLRKLYAVEKSASGLLKKLTVDSEVGDEGENEEEIMDADLDMSDDAMSSIVPLTNALVADAVRAGATDVHIEPTPDAVEVRYRVDGLLREATTLPKQVQGQVVTRLKIMAGMDIAQRRRPQDGRSKVHVDGETVDTRVSTIPTISGEKVVIRILSNGGTGLDVKKLGFLPDELEVLEDTLQLPQGLVVFTGPTGSGKTSTMYSGLSHIKTPEKNIITLEDPIEYRIPGLNQVQINNKAGISFAAGLRSILRQDPDVIMVGEIRDGETAETVIQSALTGHLVMSSLHTNDAPSVISRLTDLGIDSFLIASALSLVVAQRLVRSICEECKQEHEPSDRTLRLLGMSREEASQHTYMKGAGCHHCGHTGYRGRTGLYEVLQVTEELRQLIGSGANDTEIDEAVRNSGLVELRQVGLTKARMGVTTLEEVLRVTDAGKRTAPPAAAPVAVPVQTPAPQYQQVPVQQVPVQQVPVQAVPVEYAPVQPQVVQAPAPAPIEFPPVAPSMAPIEFPQVAEAPAAELPQVAQASAEAPAAVSDAEEATRAQIAEVIQASLQATPPAPEPIAAPEPAAAMAPEPVASAVQVAEQESSSHDDISVNPASKDREGKPCVLMIDDDKDMRTLARLRLQNRFVVAEAEDGEQGIQTAVTLAPDLILLDHRLPGDIGGIELVRKLRSDEGTKNIPLIMLTGFSDPNVEMEALAAGVADFMTKPFEWNDLASRVDNALNGESSAIREIVLPEDEYGEPIDLEEEQRVKAPRSELVYEEGETVLQNMTHGVEEAVVATDESDAEPGDAEAEIDEPEAEVDETDEAGDDMEDTTAESEGEPEMEGTIEATDLSEDEIDAEDGSFEAEVEIGEVEPYGEIDADGEDEAEDDEPAAETLADYEKALEEEELSVSEDLSNDEDGEEHEVTPTDNTHTAIPGVRIVESPIDEIRLASKSEHDETDEQETVPVAQHAEPIDTPAPQPVQTPVQPAPVQQAPAAQPAPAPQPAPVQTQPVQQQPQQPAPQPVQQQPGQQPAPQPNPAGALFGPLFDHDWTEEEWERVLTGLIASGMLSWKRLGSFVIAQQFGR